MAELNPKLVALREALQDFVNSMNENPAIVVNAVVFWEEVRYEGDVSMHGIDYASLTGGSMSGDVGVSKIGLGKMLRDLDA